ncbi:MAG: acyl-CoA thioester hydrolase [Lysobacterales bacterium]|jgi:acyl-CoA thioester hydrolase
MQKPFVWNLRVYWEDTDAGGVIYHSNYLNFFERARTEWLRSLDIHQSLLKEKHNLVFGIRKMDIDFLQAGRLDDELQVSVHSVSTGGTRISFCQEMIRKEDGVKLAEASVVAVCLAADIFRPLRLPDWIRSKIDNAEQEK